VEVLDGGKRVEVTREIDGGLETVSLSVPAVITTDLRYVLVPRWFTVIVSPVCYYHSIVSSVCTTVIAFHISVSSVYTQS
jgi:hypothetical protein